MKILPKTFQEALDLVYNILNQGDCRYNDTREEAILASFLFNNSISLEQEEILDIPKPTEEDLFPFGRIQSHEKYIAKTLLKDKGF